MSADDLDELLRALNLEGPVDVIGGALIAGRCVAWQSVIRQRYAG